VPASAPLKPRELLAFLETWPQGLLVLGADGRRLLANRAARQLRGEAGSADAALPAAAWDRLLGTTLADLASAAPGVVVTRRVPLAEAGALRTLAVRGRRCQVVLIMRVEVLRWADASTALGQRFGLAAPEVRLALRVARGQSNLAIAGAFGVPEGTVKSRLHALCEHLGVGSRAGLVRAVQRVVGAVSSVPPPARPAARDGRPRPRGMIDAAEIMALLVGLPLPLAAIRRDGRVAWANQACAAALGGPLARRAAALARVLRQAVAAAGARGPASVRVAGPAGPIRVALWRAAPGLCGAGLHREVRRRPVARRQLLRQLGLTPRQARIAALVAGDVGNAAIARRVHLSVSAVEAELTTIYARLGVESRTGLLALLLEEEAARG
jgi:DNA-binding NarL/FixJ family response regulator